jgi:glutamate-1-semialdehyde 2,1-aminomutase
MYSTMQKHHASSFRHVPAASKPVSPERVAQVLADEWKLFTKKTKASEAESKRAFD